MKTTLWVPGAPPLLGLRSKNLSPGFNTASLTPAPRSRQGTTEKLRRTVVINDITQSVGLAYLINKCQPCTFTQKNFLL